MSRLKDETLSIPTSAETKQLLGMAVERERRSLALMLEIPVLECPRAHVLKQDRHSNETAKRGT